jgi:hypothetical protein
MFYVRRLVLPKLKARVLGALGRGAPAAGGHPK